MDLVAHPFDVLPCDRGRHASHGAGAWPWPAVAIPVVVAAGAVPHRNALLLVGGVAALMVALTVYGVLRGDPERSGKR